MSAAAPTVVVHYPDSDGEPMAEHTIQFLWIVTIHGNLDLLFRTHPDVFVAGNHLIYPVEGNNLIRQAPDVYVAFGRPKRHRGSYQVWEEGGIFPQVIFEVLSPGNRRAEMARKLAFYDRHGADEYYVLDPIRGTAEGYIRQDGELADIDSMDGWVSPALGVRFARAGGWQLFHPDGSAFRSFVEVGEQADEARRQADEARRQAETDRQDKARLAAKLRELGVDPDAV